MGIRIRRKFGRNGKVEVILFRRIVAKIENFKNTKKKNGTNLTKFIAFAKGTIIILSSVRWKKHP